MSKPPSVDLRRADDRESRVRSSLAMWTSLRRAWADIALTARERGDRGAAARAELELIRCELECAAFARRSALAGDDAAGVLQSANNGMKQRSKR
jgi:hypothetical protein